MESWIDIINDDAADQDSDRIILPPPSTVDLNPSGSAIKEIKYRFDEENPERIIRTETKYEIIDVKKRVSKEAELRRKRWRKFGACKNVPKGQLERGITAVRDGNFAFQFNQRDGTEKKKKPEKKQVVTKAVRRTAAEIASEAKQLDAMDRYKAAQNASSKPSGGYVPPGRRGGFSSYSSVFDEDNKVEIKISNLPQWAEFMNVKFLIDSFYKNHLHRQYIPKYKIRMIPSKRTLEQWKAEPKVYAHKLREYERLAIVEFENEEMAQKAITTLDGHQYDAHILRVEKAKPRPF